MSLLHPLGLGLADRQHLGRDAAKRLPCTLRAGLDSPERAECRRQQPANGCRHLGGKDFLMLVDGIEDLVYAGGEVRMASQEVADRLAALAFLLGAWVTEEAASVCAEERVWA